MLFIILFFFMYYTYVNVLFAITSSKSAISLKIRGAFKIIMNKFAKLIRPHAIQKKQWENSPKSVAQPRRYINDNAKHRKWAQKMGTVCMWIEIPPKAWGRKMPQNSRIFCVDWNIFIVARLLCNFNEFSSNYFFLQNTAIWVFQWNKMKVWWFWIFENLVWKFSLVKLWLPPMNVNNCASIKIWTQICSRWRFYMI